jgi:hypothetical protein
VLAAVDFDDRSGRITDEINDEIVDRRLAAEMKTLLF